MNKLGTRTIDAYLHRPAFELYDLTADPTESNNLADDADYQAIKQKLMLKIQQFQKDTADPWITKWEHE